MFRLSFLAALSLLARAGFGQVPLDNLVSTAGTVTTNAAGQAWAYLVWQGTTPSLLTGQVFAVYMKAGDAASTDLYQRRALARLETDPTLIQSLLSRAANLGDDPLKLEQDIDSLFEKIMPASTLSLPSKISAVLRGISGNSDQYSILILLSRLHPAVGLCLGNAHADPIPPGLTTFEVRLFDPTHDRDLSVVGRVTLEANRPIILPAPGGPVEVPELSPKGHLNIKLRWATPEPLRRLSLLQFGFDVWRVARDYAQSNLWDSPNPSPSAVMLWAHSLGHTNEVKRCNPQPVLTDKNLSLQEASDLGTDPTTMFYVDDDGRILPGYTMVNFTNGAQFYYFVSARDILGRDGEVSPGTLVTVCDRLPPRAPVEVQVVNDYRYANGVASQSLKVLWSQTTNAPTDVEYAYYVYRWTNLLELQTRGGNPTNNLIAGPILQFPGQTLTEYLDEGPGAPSTATDTGRTFWYTIRTEKFTAGCGSILSGHSPPVFGVLRDRVGPEVPTGHVRIHCVIPRVEWLTNVDQAGQPPVSDVYRYRLACATSDSRIVSAEFFYQNPVLTGGSTNFLGRQDFASSGQALFDQSLPRQGVNEFYCRVRLLDGRLSMLTSSPYPVGQSETDDQIRLVLFRSWIDDLETYPGGPCVVHETAPSGSVSTTACIQVELDLKPTTQEWRLYRQVDAGPITMFCQGTNGPAELSVTNSDCELPVNAGNICYYAQLFDEQGNPSPLARLDCVMVSGRQPPPVPTLYKLKSGGTVMNPTMEVKWFCPPYGVERFVLYIRGDLPSQPSTNLTSRLQIDSSPFKEFDTRRIGPVLGYGPEFQVSVSIMRGDYEVYVVAVGVDGKADPSRKSNSERLSWTPFSLASWQIGPQVPWPALGLPRVASWPSNTVLARRLSLPTFEGVGVRIGEMWVTEIGRDLANAMRPELHTNIALWTFYTNSSGDKVLPLVLYRCQTPNANYPQVSGSVVQVSPLVEEVAWQLTPKPSILIQDPFFEVLVEDAARHRWGLYLLDTLPVIKGASYKYLLVRFKPDNHEVAEVIPTNELEVTP